MNVCIGNSPRHGIDHNGENAFTRDGKLLYTQILLFSYLLDVDLALAMPAGLGPPEPGPEIATP